MPGGIGGQIGQAEARRTALALSVIGVQRTSAADSMPLRPTQASVGEVTWDAGRVYEWHGWATISDTASVNYFDDDPSPAVLASIRALLAGSADIANETADLRIANGQHHVWLAGFHNHLAPHIIELFRGIAAVAPGSYGVLYTHNDNASNAWDRWVMRRGQVHHEHDHSLSPHIGQVEDAEEA